MCVYLAACVYVFRSICVCGFHSVCVLSSVRVYSVLCACIQFHVCVQFWLCDYSVLCVYSVLCMCEFSSMCVPQNHLLLTCPCFLSVPVFSVPHEGDGLDQGVPGRCRGPLPSIHPPAQLTAALSPVYHAPLLPPIHRGPMKPVFLCKPVRTSEMKDPKW